jgi:hypothetical protein
MAAKQSAMQSKKRISINLKPGLEPAPQQQPLPGNNDEPAEKSGRKRPGRKASAKVTDPDPGTAGFSLRSAINRAVASQPGRIARALIDESIKGNVSSAKLLIEFTGARTAADPNQKKPFSWATFFTNDAEWQDPAAPPAEVQAPDPVPKL